MSANQQQIGGEHYMNKKIQPWDFIAANDLGYLEGCVVKYVSRHKEKNGIEDLAKARHYLDKLIEINAPAAPAQPTSVETVAAIKPAVQPKRRGRPPGSRNKPKRVYRKGAK
jgi:hypothetical protein